MSLDRLAKRCKEGVFEAGGYPIEFMTIAVSDGISMGHEGMRASLVSREVICDSIETMMHAERFDAMVTFAGCDKSLPGMLMAAARIDLPAVFVYGGSILPGHLRRPGARHRERLRGGRCERGGQPERRGALSHRAQRVPDRGILRWDVHRQHDGLCRRGARYVASRVRVRPGGRPPPRRPGGSPRGRRSSGCSSSASDPARS